MRCSCSFASASRRRRACSRNFRVASEPSGWNIPAVRLRVAPPPVGVAAIISSLMPAIVTRRYRGREGLRQQRDRIGILARFTGGSLTGLTKGFLAALSGIHKGRRRFGKAPRADKGSPGLGRRPHVHFTSQGRSLTVRFPYPAPADARPARDPGLIQPNLHHFSQLRLKDAPENQGHARPRFVKGVQICPVRLPATCTSAPPP